MMDPDSKSVAQVLDNPKRFIGKKCRAKIETSREFIEEAGQTMEVTTLVGVEWP